METGTWKVKSGLAQMLKGGVIMDVVNAEHAKVAEEAGACAVMALERVPADIRAGGASPVWLTRRLLKPL
jgi:pyridoxal 5'-phosphate synthase pdxS subunit